MRKRAKLAQFAAFYSDKVYIHNFIVDHLRLLESERYPNEFLMQSNFANDLAVFQYLRPLIEAGIVVPIATPHYCPDHFVQDILHEESNRRLSSALKKLAKRYTKELNYTLNKEKNGFFNLVMKGPEELLEHSYLSIVNPEPPPHYKKDRHLRKKLDQGLEVRLSRRVVEEMQLDITMTDFVFQNIVFELVASQCLNTSYVTERPVEIALLNDITTNDAVQERNRVIRDHLTCLVPFIDDVSAVDVLRLRDAEEESFIKFRRVLNKAVEDSISSGRQFSATVARQIYQDLIRPELSNLDSKIKRARRKLLRDTATKVGAWGAAIGIGLYTGIVPAELALAAKTLGLTKIVAELGEAVLKGIRPTSEIKDADLYFLWRVRKGAEQS